MENNNSKPGPPSEKTAMEDLFGYMDPITILQFVSATQDEERVSIVYSALSHLQLFDPTALQRAKSAVEAARLRDKGSAEWTSRPQPNLAEALTWFTMCIAVRPEVGQADAHSADLALDFASRSAVLYALGRYEECLSDVEQASKRNYPPDQQYLLHMRRGDCLHIMGRTSEAKTSFEAAVTALPIALDLPPSERKRQLCYARVQLARIAKGYAREEGYRERRERPPPRLADGGNPRVPAMAGCVEICNSERWGRHVRATRDIKPGEVLIVEEPYVSILWNSNYKTHCYNCFRRYDALIPCKTCPLVMFCSEKCRETSWQTSHASECPLLFLLSQVPRYHFLLTPLRVVLVAVKHYRGLRGLHDHVKRMEVDEKIRRSQGANRGERTDETTNGDRTMEKTNKAALMEVTNGDRATVETNKAALIEVTNGDRATVETNKVALIEVTNGDRATVETNKAALMEVTNGDRATVETNKAALIEVTNGDRATVETNKAALIEVTNGDRATVETNKAALMEVTNGDRAMVETNKAALMEVTNGDRATVETNEAALMEVTNGDRATVETNKAALMAVTNGIERADVTNSNCTKEEPDASRQIEKTNNVQATKAINNAKSREASDAGRQTEATSGVRPTKSRKNRKRTKANSVRPIEDTNNARTTGEATDASRQTEAANASRQPEATDDVPLIAGFNVEGRYLSSDYTAVHHMLTNSRQLTVHKLWPYALNAALLVKCMESCGELKKDLESCEMKRFLGGLLLRYEMIVASNGYPIDEYSPVVDPAQTAKTRGVGGAVYPTAGLLNHACDANTCGYQRGDTVVVTATQHIARGEQVFIDYVGQRLSIHAPPSTRRSYLEEQFHFTCHCPLCTLGLPTADLAALLLSWRCMACHTRLQGGSGTHVTCHQCRQRTATHRLRGEAEERVARFKGLARRARGSGDVTGELGEAMKEMCGEGETQQLVMVFKSMLRMNCTQAGKYFLED